jgi:hypothetical protein
MSEYLSSGMTALIAGVGAGVAVATNILGRFLSSRLNGRRKKPGFDQGNFDRHNDSIKALEADVRSVLVQHGSRLTALETSVNHLHSVIKTGFTNLEKRLNAEKDKTGR